MPYPLTIFANPRRARRNPTPYRFRDLPVDTVFEFDHAGLPLSSGIARGPWRKTGATTYTALSGRLAGERIRVGSGNVRVIPQPERYEGNPRRRAAHQQSSRVYQIKYKHSQDGEDYKHDFAPGVCMELLTDGSVRLYRKDGRSLFKNFPD